MLKKPFLHAYLIKTSITSVVRGAQILRRHEQIEAFQRQVTYPEGFVFFEKIVPAVLLAMGVIMVGLILPQAFCWGSLNSSQKQSMYSNHILPFFSTVIMLVFTLSVLQRFAVRRQANFLFWGIGLAMFSAGSFAEAYLALAWNKWVFFV